MSAFLSFVFLGSEIKLAEILGGVLIVIGLAFVIAARVRINLEFRERGAQGPRF